MKKVKQRQRERVQPKMGRNDVDYQVLHDAFFKWQTKPYLSGAGDLYFEGKEFEVHLKTKKPGALSAALKAALGMPDGAPPPWLINMQRYGPPPSYPNLRIPGLNAPIPEGASFGYHPGGWGKPPVDEYGMPLYGDVFGARAAMQARDEYVPDRTHWAELIVRDDEYDDEDEDDEEDAPVDVPRRNRSRRDDTVSDDLSASVNMASGIETPLDTSSIASGIETPSAIDLRKRASGTDTPSSEAPPLYRVIDEQPTTGAHASSALFASDKRYNVQAPISHPDDQPPPPGTTSSRATRVDDDDDDDDETSSNLRKRKLDTSGDARGKKTHKDFKF